LRVFLGIVKQKISLAGYPKVEGYPSPGYPAQGYAPQGYPPQGYPPQQGYGQPAQPYYEEQRRRKDTGFLEGW